jgi:hypothetical protein
MAAVASTALASAAAAGDTYTCGDQICYDDQADETRRLNEMQLENPGEGAEGVPPPGYDDGGGNDDRYEYDEERGGQGGPYERAGPDEGPYGDEDAYGADDAYTDYPDESMGPPDEHSDDGFDPYDDRPEDNARTEPDEHDSYPDE